MTVYCEKLDTNFITTINKGVVELFLFNYFIRSDCDSLPQFKEALDKTLQSSITVLHKESSTTGRNF